MTPFCIRGELADPAAATWSECRTNQSCVVSHCPGPSGQAPLDVTLCGPVHSKDPGRFGAHVRCLCPNQAKAEITLSRLGPFSGEVDSGCTTMMPSLRPTVSRSDGPQWLRLLDVPGPPVGDARPPSFGNRADRPTLRPPPRQAQSPEVNGPATGAADGLRQNSPHRGQSSLSSDQIDRLRE